LWEIFSYGKNPYAAWSNLETFENVGKGYRMPSPGKECPDEIYKLMLSCWNEKAEERPTFAQLYDEIKNYWIKNYNIKKDLTNEVKIEQEIVVQKGLYANLNNIM